MRHRLAGCRGVRVMSGDPAACLAHWQQERPPAERLLLVEFDLRRHWAGEGDRIPLTALYLLAGETVRVAVTDAVLAGDGSLDAGRQFAQWVDAHGLLEVDPTAPLPLCPLSVPKPWGVEIWYTGVERRGVCRFGEDGRSVPIPWLRPALPGGCAGVPGRDLLLLKVLASRREAVHGELYFELHRHKHEVYVITAIDSLAWPDGVGYMRFGTCEEQRRRFPDENRFRSAYLAAAADYEAVRRELDALPPAEEPAPALLAMERRLREALNRFTALRPLRAGDVVAVPTRVPHALLHGLRAVEIQTPTYERLILSFPQRVLTQDRWDTAAAVSEMAVQLPPELPAAVLDQADGVLLELIAQCPDFEVRRLCIGSGRAWTWPPLSRYALLMVGQGTLMLGSRPLAAEQAVLLPAGWTGELQAPERGPGTTVLAALPR